MNITDLDKLKITKVKLWAIYFDYDNKHYLLHGSNEDYESYQTLYERTIDANGHYELYPIMAKDNRTEYLWDEYIKTPSRTLVYSQINKKYFVYRLTLNGLVTSMYTKEIIRTEKKIDTCRKQIKKQEEKIYQLRRKINEVL